MFGLFKSKKIEIYAPATGEIVDLASVPDEVFSARMAGDGVAIIPTSGIFCSPIDGVIKKIFPTKHAFVVANGELEAIVHIGIDTVELKGDGFTALREAGGKVKAGDEIIKADLDLIANRGKSIITPIVVNKSVNSVNLGDAITSTVVMVVS